MRYISSLSLKAIQPHIGKFREEFVKKAIVSFFFIAAYSHSLLAALPSLNADSLDIHAKKGSLIYVPFTLTIPDNGYIYANPKGPGTGKPLSIKVVPGSVLNGKIMIDRPIRYTPESEALFVWIYKSAVKIYIPVRVDDRNVRITITGLFCSDNGRCTPFSTAAHVVISADAEKNDESLMKAEGTIPFGNDPSEHFSGGTIIDTSSLRVKPGNNLKDEKSSHQSGSPQSSDVKTESLPKFTPEYLSSDVSGLLQAILFGLIAGLILNFMPCVLPVLSLKIMGLITRSRNRTEIVKIGLIYTAGIIFSFAILASLASFAGYGWGALFQKSWFLLLVILIIFSMALSFFGVYTFSVPSFARKVASKKTGSSLPDTFFRGSLAAILATPCSGPFLGATLAWSMTKSPLEIFLVFLSIGMGMSLPFLAITVRPSLISWLPKPGAWMSQFEKIMGFLLVGSVVYFLSILNPGKIVPALVMLIVSAIALWQFGEWGKITRTRRSRILSSILLVLLIGSALIIPFIFGGNSPRLIGTTTPYSHDALMKNSMRGVTVVQFTADWCPNCRIVERSTLYSDEIVRLFKERGITVLVADITEQETQGEYLLHELGSRSIPFLAVFPQGEKFTKPVCLRDLYSKDDIRRALEKTAR
jgi:thiol:disulfide interchange protein